MLSNDDLYPDWIDFVIDYVKNSNYGVQNNVCDKNDVIEYFYQRANIENQVFNILDVKKHIVNIQEIDKSSLNTMVYDIIVKN